VKLAIHPNIVLMLIRTGSTSISPYTFMVSKKTTLNLFCQLLLRRNFAFSKCTAVYNILISSPVNKIVHV